MLRASPILADTRGIRAHAALVECEQRQAVSLPKSTQPFRREWPHVTLGERVLVGVAVRDAPTQYCPVEVVGEPGVTVPK